MDLCVFAICIAVIFSATALEAIGHGTDCCENGGTYDHSLRLCYCPDNYWGTYCQFRGVCTRLCQNGGECGLDDTGRYRCICQTGYYGDLCDSTSAENSTSPSQNISIELLCATASTPTTPSTDGKWSFDLAMMIMYLIIGALILAFVVLTIHYKREYKHIRQQQRRSLRRRLDSMRESYLARECCDVETPPQSPSLVAAPPLLMTTTTATRLKMISPAMAPPYSESPPPYDAIIISTIIEEDEEEEEDET